MGRLQKLRKQIRLGRASLRFSPRRSTHMLVARRCSLLSRTPRRPHGECKGEGGLLLSLDPDRPVAEENVARLPAPSFPQGRAAIPACSTGRRAKSLRKGQLTHPPPASEAAAPRKTASKPRASYVGLGGQHTPFSCCSRDRRRLPRRFGRRVGPMPLGLALPPFPAPLPAQPVGSTKERRLPLLHPLPVH